MKKFMGIDPGLSNTGYGIINASADSLTVISSGCITTTTAKTLPERLQIIYENLSAIITEYQPDIVAVEELHSVARFARIAILMGHARGIALMTAAKFNLPVTQFQPTMAKNIVTGFGRSSKEQVRRAVSARLNLSEVIKNEHIADALAIALCCILSQSKAAQIVANSLYGRK